MNKRQQKLNQKMPKKKLHTIRMAQTRSGKNVLANTKTNNIKNRRRRQNINRAKAYKIPVTPVTPIVTEVKKDSFFDTFKNKLNEIKQNISKWMNSVSDKVSPTLTTVKEKTSEFSKKTSEGVNKTKTAIKTNYDKVAGIVGPKWNSFKQFTSEKATIAKEKYAAFKAVQDAKFEASVQKRVQEMIEEDRIHAEQQAIIDAKKAEKAAILQEKEEKRKAEKIAKWNAQRTKREEKKALKAEKKKNKPKKKHLFLKIVLTLLVLSLLAGGVGGYYFYRWFESLIADAPELNLDQRYTFSQSTILYDSNGEFLAEYGTGTNIEWVDSEDMPDMLKKAFVSVEDERFYSHFGIDIKRLVAAVYGELTGTSEHGASTITQQLIKNQYLTQERTYQRKAQEIYLAIELEKELSKDEILEWYMNTIYLGESNYGVKNAAHDYFGKELDELTLRETAMIAGLTQSPNIYNPRINTINGTMDATNRRTNNVLYAMLKNEVITEDEYNKALKETVTVRTEGDPYVLYDYPIFVEYAVENVATQLVEKDGNPLTEENIEEKKTWLRQAGLSIYTSLDREKQDITQTAVTEWKKYPYTRTGDPAEASAVIMEQHTGRVIAMVGGREEPTEPEGFNRAVDSKQPVGSSIKPLAVYGPAMEVGYFPGTTVLDAKVAIEGYETEDGYPGGDDDNEMVSLRRALKESHNIPACRTLLELVGMDKAIEILVKEGFDPSHLDATPAGIALGASSVTTLEMTAGYATLANDGVYIEPHAYSKVVDRRGNVLLDESECETHRVFSEQAAWLTTDMMQSNMINGLGVNARLTNVASAGKTGTHEHKVVTFGGYTPDLTSFVRISTDNYVDFVNSTSYTQSSGLWKSYMNQFYPEKDDRTIHEKTAEELGIKKYYVCTNTGMLAHGDEGGQWEYAWEEKAPDTYCDYNHTFGVVEEEDGYWDEWGNWISFEWWDDLWNQWW